MRIFFWQFDDHNDIARQLSLFLLNLLVFIFTVFALIGTIRKYCRPIFQLIPLSVNCISTLILLLLKLFERGYEFDEVGYVDEIFTYFLFSYTFAMMYARVIPTAYKGLIMKIFNVLLIILVVAFFLISTLVFTKVISKDCDRGMLIPALISFSSQVVSYIPTLYFGCRIYSSMVKQQQLYISTGSVSQNLLSSSSDEYIKQRKKQILIVLITYTLSLLLRGIFLYLSKAFDYLFMCQMVENVFIITSDSVAGQIILVGVQINQLLPHIMIPIALYIVPSKQIKNKPIILATQTLYSSQLDEQQFDIKEGEVLKNKIRTSITSKYSDINSPTKSNTK